MHRAAKWLAVCCAVAAPAVALGDEPHPLVTLVYSVEPRVTGCPEERELKNAVSARLGYDPFRDGATRTVEVRIAREGRAGQAGRSQSGLRAHVGLRVAGGKERGSRDLVSRRGDCGELASSLTLAISIAIDPLALSAVSEPPPPAAPTVCPPPPMCPPPSTGTPPPVCPPPPPAPVCPPPISPAVPERAPRPVGFRFGAGPVLSAGVAPTPVAVGLMLRAGLQVGAFSLDLEGRVDPGWEQLTTPPRGLKTTLLLASLSPCFHYRWLALCGLVGGGVIRGSGLGVMHTADDQSAFAVAGGRVALEIPLYHALHLAISADALAHLTQVSFRLDGKTEYTTPGGSGALGVVFLGKFP